MRSLADELDDAEEEVTGQAQIHVNGGTVLVGETGRFAAVETPTKPDNVRPPASEPPKVAKAAVSIIQAVNNPYALGALALLVAALWIWLTNR